MADKNIKAIT